MKALPRSLAIVLLVAIFCCIISVPRADEPPRDSLAKYLPSDTLFLLEVPDLGATLLRGRDLAITKYVGESNLLGQIYDLIGWSLNDAGYAQIHFTRFEKYLAEISTQYSLAFSGRLEVALPSGRGGISSFVAAFPVAPGKDSEAKAAVEAIVDRLATLVNREGTRVEKTEHKGAALFGLHTNFDPEEVRKPWFSVVGGYALVTLDIATMRWAIDSIVSPPTKNLLSVPAFRSGYSAVAGKDVRCYLDLGGFLKGFPAFRARLKAIAGKDSVSFLENASLTCGLSFANGAVVDDLCLNLGGKQWPFAESTFLAEVPCLGLSAGLFPPGATLYGSASVDFTHLFEAFAQRSPRSEIESLKAKGIDIEKGIAPLLGPECSFGVSIEGAVPASMIAIQLKDTSAALKWFKNMAQIEKQVLDEPLQIGGATLFPYRSEARDLLDLPQEAGQIAFAVSDGWLLYGPLQYLKDRIISKAERLSNCPDFSAVIPAVVQKRPHALAYLSLRSIARQYYPQLVNTIAKMGRQYARIAEKMPPLETVEAVASPLAAWGIVTSDGGKVFSQGPTSLSPILIASVLSSMHNAGLDASEASTISTCQAFGKAAIDYSQTRATQDFWPSGTTDFAPYFKHESPRAGIKFAYFAEESEFAVKFVYLAVPVDRTPDKRAFYIDESQTIYQAWLSTDEQYKALADIKGPGVDWKKNDADRLSIRGVIFSKK
ncbi:MAG: hypothetical protein WC712_03970 [Candidatus Brocadiia bacterium]